MSTLDLLLAALAGLGAGAVNAAAGGGTLVSYPALLALGLTPTAAVVTSGVGLLPGYVGATLGYRREVAELAGRLRPLLLWAALGGAAGGVLLLVVGDDAVSGVVPWLVLLASLLLGVQPVAARLAGRERAGRSSREGGRRVGAGALAAVTAGAVYGGFFGAALGVVLLVVLGHVLGLGLQRANAAKAAISLVVNGAAVVVFVADALVRSGSLDVPAAAAVAAGALVGGWGGSRVARRLPDLLLRVVVVVGGSVVAVVLLVA